MSNQSHVSSLPLSSIIVGFQDEPLILSQGSLVKAVDFYWCCSLKIDDFALIFQWPSLISSWLARNNNDFLMMWRIWNYWFFVTIRIWDENGHKYLPAQFHPNPPPHPKPAEPHIRDASPRQCRPMQSNAVQCNTMQHKYHRWGAQTADRRNLRADICTTEHTIQRFGM